MSIAESVSVARDRAAAAPAKILEFKHALMQRTGAMGGWAKHQAESARHVVERRPYATAGVSVGVALLGGLALGLLLSRRAPTLSGPARPVRSRLKAMLHR